MHPGAYIYVCVYIWGSPDPQACGPVCQASLKEELSYYVTVGSVVWNKTLHFTFIVKSYVHTNF